MKKEEIHEQEIVIDFRTLDKSIAGEIKNSMSDPDTEIIESSAFSGTEIITVILPVVLPSLVILLDKALNFYIQNRKSVRETTIKIGKDEISLAGFSEDEMKELIEGDSLEKLKQLIKGNG